LRENEQLAQAAALHNMRADHETEKLLSSLSESQSKLALLQQTV
jgi:ABC-type molybdenum transport system ATPase subunit/photorepair protein PhrA